MALTLVRYQTKANRADENQALVEDVFAELGSARPAGLRYVTLRLDDGVSFIHVASIDRVDGANPLTTTPAFGVFQQEIADRCEVGPLVTAATIVGSYRFSVDTDDTGS